MQLSLHELTGAGLPILALVDVAMLLFDLFLQRLVVRFRLPHRHLNMMVSHLLLPHVLVLLIETLSFPSAPCTRCT